MTNYLLLYRTDPAMGTMPEPTPDEGAAMMDAWTAWGARAGAALVDFGNPTRVASPGADATVGGYSMMQAESFGDVARLLEGHPHTVVGGSIDVYEITPIAM